MATNPTLQASMDALRRSFAGQLPARADTITQSWQAIRAGSGSMDIPRELLRLVHSLAGTSRTYGFPELGQAAKDIELKLQTTYDQGRLPGPDALPDLDEPFQAWHHLCLEAASSVAAQTEPHSPAPAVFAEGGTLVYLLEDDLSQAAFLATQLGHFGYDVRHFQDIDSLHAGLRQEAPRAMIFDIVIKEGPMAGIQLASSLNRSPEQHLPIIFISSRSDFQARLEAVRADGSAYLTKPVDINQLVDTLDRLTAKNAPKPFRILIVDDDASLAKYHESILHQAGMETLIVNRPLEVLKAIADFAPELILMDMYMPDCTAHELAQIIRQQGAYASIPIVFLSAEQDVEKQYDALRTGGVDFLTKPIDAKALIRTLCIRADRARLLNSMMDRDSMTGLLNHARIKERLSAELARARRKNATLSVAMIDIDKFKAINDAHGHPVGDRVIKSMARLIKERLRESDTAGRYGGEEFMMVLPDCDTHQAARIVDDLRLRFGEIQHAGGAGNNEFAATFSAGVTSFPICSDTEQMINTADAALYEAKHRGRNHVVMATKAVEPTPPAKK